MAVINFNEIDFNKSINKDRISAFKEVAGNGISYKFDNKQDAEIAGFIASMFAYGKREVKNKDKRAQKHAE